MKIVITTVTGMTTAEYAAYYVELERRDNTRVLNSLFGNSLILSGSHPSIKSKVVRLSEEVSSISSHSHAIVNRISIQPLYE